MPALFTLTLFTSAFLLFLVQPMLARMVLPLLGGTPAVWNTCMVFFQALLLVGYAYAHAAPARLGARTQAVLHVGLLLLPLLVLPIAVPADWSPTDPARPVPALLALLVVAVGLPFFVVSTSGPLLQRWFAATGHRHAGDPYFLYSASNFGSMLALFGYPFLLEPRLGLTEQSRVWAIGYGALVILTAACAAVVVRRAAPSPAVDPTPVPHVPLPRARRLRWVLLAFVPSSLMLSVTTYLTTDIAAIPLFWVLPLATYLLTFILVFARRQPIPLSVVLRWMPLVVLVIVLVLLSEATEPVGVLIAIHLTGLFWVGMACHGLLAADRPPVDHLTEFYFWLSVGGVLGGLFNALVAPQVFYSVAEYPLVLVLACLLRPAGAADPKRETARRRLDLALPAILGLVTAGLVIGAQAAGVAPGPTSLAVMFAAPVVVCYTFLDRPVRFGLGVAAVLLASCLYRGVLGKVEYRTRSFFGVHRVTRDVTGKFRVLAHGNTVHGMQSLDPAHRGEALTYYHRNGPAGSVLASIGNDPRAGRVGLIGLGCGSLLAYAKGGQHWTCFEIDPAVDRIARDPGLFTFIRDAQDRGVTVDTVLGDARMTLRRSDERFGVLVIDAFSSDAIPVHLLTREALQVYLDHLDDHGFLLFNVSNRYLDLEPVLSALAIASEPRLACVFQDDRDTRPSEKRAGKWPSQWGMIARRAADVPAAARGGLWRLPRARPGLPAWTDDFSNLFSVLKMPDERPD